MNICFIKGKIITEPEYKFTFIRNADAVIMFEIELEKEDIIWLEGRIEEKQIVIKELVKNKNKT